MNFDYIVLILIIIGILGGMVFWEIIKHFKYELNFKESLLFPILILALTILCLTDFSLLKINIGYRISIGILIYFLALLTLYYIIRSIKLKKYVAMKAIIFYCFIAIIFSVIIFNILGASTSHISGWDALGLFIIYVVFCVYYIVSLVLINVILFLIKIIRKENIDFKNINYKISKFSYFNILTAIVIIGSIFGIDYYNESNHNKMLQYQREIVIDYLNREYPNYEFEIREINETEVDCWMFGCRTPVIRNEIVNKTTNKIFNIDVKKEDLTIYDDGFKIIIEEDMQ